MFDIKKFVDGLHDYISRALRPVVDRIAEAETKLAQLPVPKDGAPGVDGLPGKAGVDGPAGRDGIDGKDGAPGVDGVNGEPGRDGVDGKDGSPGTDGKDGADGEIGPPGVDGQGGEPGVAGEPGLPGKDGIDGKDGQDGAPGSDGRSITIEEVDALVQSAVERAMARMPMAKDGTAGRDGADGLSGADGEPGRDAAHIEILPAIDAEKSYPRGTYAKHAGGLWRSFETTAAMKGWECIVDGVADLSVNYNDARSFEVVVTRSSGDVARKAIELPALIYRGVFRDGEAYAQGDTVTWGGSLWHCNEATNDKPADGSKSWQLCVKKGRDGKDAPGGSK